MFRQHLVTGRHCTTRFHRPADGSTVESSCGIIGSVLWHPQAENKKNLPYMESRTSRNSWIFMGNNRKNSSRPQFWGFHAQFTKHTCHEIKLVDIAVMPTASKCRKLMRLQLGDDCLDVAKSTEPPDQGPFWAGGSPQPSQKKPSESLVLNWDT